MSANICFVSLNAYPVMSGDKNLQFAGGAEVQQAILSRALAKHGFGVSMICLDHGQPDGIEIDGVKIFRAFKQSDGIPVLRFVYPRLLSIWKAMERANADIYYQRCAGYLTGIVAEFCRRRSKKSIYAIANHFDFRPHKQSRNYERELWLYKHNIKLARDRWLYEYGIRQVDQIVVQNPIQQRLCMECYGREAKLIPNLFTEPVSGSGNSKGHVLWVGSIRVVKRPELFIELARRFPNHQFVMVGGVFESDYSYYEAIREQARTVPNLVFKGFVPYAQINEVFDGASVLVCTSEAEGFPNTFLQAWVRGIPVISYFDTGFRQNGRPVEHLVNNLEEAQEALEQLLFSDENWMAEGQKARSHFEKTHSLESVLNSYFDMLSTFNDERHKVAEQSLQ